MMTETETTLLALAQEQGDRISYWPKVQGESLLAKVRELESPPVGNDWTRMIPDDLWEIWDDLPVEAQLAAFVVAANYTSVSPGRHDYD